MLTRNGRKILDHNLTCLIREDVNFPTVLEELVLDIHEYPDLVTQQILQHRLFKDLALGLFRMMDRHSPMNPRLAGNAAYVLGALIDSEDGRERVLNKILRVPAHFEETQNCIPNLGQLIEIHDLESMTNASGTASLLVQNEEYREWALDQQAIDWLIHVLATHLEGDMWVASNCALTLARISMDPKGREKILAHRDGEHFIPYHLIHSLGCDQEGRGMNAAFALAYICEDEAGIRTIAYMRDVLDMILNLINMLKSVNDDCRKNAVFCLKKMSSWPEGQDRINDDPDIDHLLKLLCNLMTSGVEDLGKMAAVTLKQLADRREGYMLQKDHSQVKSICRHVLSQMEISQAYRHDAFETLKAVLIPKPDPPTVEVIDAFTVEATWQPVVAKSGCHVWYELYNGDQVVYTGDQLSFTEGGLKEKTDYSYSVRALTDDNEESFASEVTVIQTHKAVSSPPLSLRATQVTAQKVKIEWEKPEKLMGTFKGYYVQEIGSSIHYEPVYPYHIASNLNPDSEYSFQVCVVTNKGRGRMAKLTVKTLRQDYNAPSRPRLIAVSPGEWVVSWDQPERPSGRISGYEVLCNGKSIYFGPKTRCIASALAPHTKYRFTVTAWTSEGKTESEPAVRKTGSNAVKDAPKFKNKEELFKWLDSQELADLEQAAEEFGIHSEDDDEPQSPRKAPKAKSPRVPIAPPPRVREPQPMAPQPPNGGRGAPSRREDEQLQRGYGGAAGAEGGAGRAPPAPRNDPSPKPKPPPARRPPQKKPLDKSGEPVDDVAKKRAERREKERQAAEKRREKLEERKKKQQEREAQEAQNEQPAEVEQGGSNEAADDSLEREDTQAELDTDPDSRE